MSEKPAVQRKADVNVQCLRGAETNRALALVHHSCELLPAGSRGGASGSQRALHAYCSIDFNRSAAVNTQGHSAEVI